MKREREMKKDKLLTNKHSGEDVCIWSFAATMIACAVCYVSVYTNRLVSPDGLNCNVISWWYPEVELGRWMIWIYGRLRNFITLPVYICFIGFVLLALTSFFCCKMLDIKNKLSGILIGLLIAVFPCIANCLSLFYYIQAYFATTFFAVLAVYLAYTKKARLVILGAVLLCIGLGGYQVGISIAVTMSIVMLLKDIFNYEKSIKNILEHAVCFLIMGVLGIGSYMIVTQIVCKFTGIELRDYSGISTMGQIDLYTLLNRICKTYTTTYKFYFTDGLFNNLAWGNRYFYAAIFVVGSFFLIYIIIKKKLFKDKARFVLFLLFIGILPIGLDALEVIAPERNLNFVLCMSMVIPLICCVKLFDFQLKNRSVLVGRSVGLIALLLLCHSYWMYDNAIYLGIEESTNKAVSLANRIIYRMEETQGYTSGGV